MRTRVGVIGVGALGQHHARVYAELPEATLVGVHDRDPERAREVAARAAGQLVDRSVNYFNCQSKTTDSPAPAA